MFYNMSAYICELLIKTSMKMLVLLTSEEDTAHYMVTFAKIADGILYNSRYSKIKNPVS